MIYAIDPHVHLRDWGENAQETLEHGLRVARDSGVLAVFEMPNTKPSIFERETVIDRIKLADMADVDGVFHGLYMGLTRKADQVKRAVDVYREFFPRVVGFKLYAGHSTNDLGVTDQESQKMIYDVLSKEGYNGVLSVHCEKEEHIHRGDFVYWKAITHCHAQPEAAETESVKDQINFAENYGFGGKLHIAHISSPGAVDLVDRARKEGMDISCEIAPHHFIFDWGKMHGSDGLLYKMNPPLRSPESRKGMLQRLKDGRIDFIATDSAPHLLSKKRGEPFASGIPGIHSWPVAIEFLRQNDFSDAEIEKLVLLNPIERFGVGNAITKPRMSRKIIYRGKDYEYDPYGPMAKEIDWKLEE